MIIVRKYPAMFPFIQAMKMKGNEVNYVIAIGQRMVFICKLEITEKSL